MKMINKMVPDQLGPYFRLARFDKPIGIALLLWPTLWGLWIAGKGRPDLSVVLIFIMGTVLMRSAGCVINDIADRHFDRFVQRTCQRPLITGEVSLLSACLLAGVLLTSAWGLVCLLNGACMRLAMVGVLLAMVYPLMKRVTHLPQFGLGLAFSWGIPMAFAALQTTVPLQAWGWFLTAALWPIIYDTLYAAVDKNDDIKIGVKSTAILFGQRLHSIIIILQCTFLLLLMLMGHWLGLSFLYDLSLFVVAGLFIYQFFLMQQKKYFKAFLHNHWVGATIFMGIVLGYLC